MPAGFKPNPDRYERIRSNPHQSLSALKTAFHDLKDELDALRFKYKLPELYVLVGSRAIENGHARAVHTTIGFGDPMRWALDLAGALAAEKKRMHDLVDSIADGESKDEPVPEKPLALDEEALTVINTLVRDKGIDDQGLAAVARRLVERIEEEHGPLPYYDKAQTIDPAAIPPGTTAPTPVKMCVGGNAPGCAPCPNPAGVGSDFCDTVHAYLRRSDNGK